MVVARGERLATQTWQRCVSAFDVLGGQPLVDEFLTASESKRGAQSACWGLKNSYTERR